MQLIRQVDLEYVDLKFYDNGILHINHKGNSPMTIDQLQEIIAIRDEWFGEEKALILSTATDTFKMPTKEASKFIQSSDREKNILADAYIIKTFPEILALKAMFFVKKSKVPIAGFKSYEKAVEWLLSQKTK